MLVLRYSFYAIGSRSMPGSLLMSLKFSALSTQGFFVNNSPGSPYARFRSRTTKHPVSRSMALSEITQHTTRPRASFLTLRSHCVSSPFRPLLGSYLRPLNRLSPTSFFTPPSLLLRARLSVSAQYVGFFPAQSPLSPPAPFNCPLH